MEERKVKSRRQSTGVSVSQDQNPKGSPNKPETSKNKESNKIITNLIMKNMRKVFNGNMHQSKKNRKRHSGRKSQLSQNERV